MNDSVFNLYEQNEHIESKIVVALERVSEAFRVLLWQNSKEFGLSPIQIQLLIFINFHQTKYAKVSYLAEEFKLSKPTISEAVRILEQKKMIQKTIDETDTRSYSITLTHIGKEIAQKLAPFSDILKFSISLIPEDAKVQLWQSLLKVITALHEAQAISLQRMCFSCVHYQHRESKHFCLLLNKNLQNTEIRLDCDEHIQVK